MTASRAWALSLLVAACEPAKTPDDSGDVGGDDSHADDTGEGALGVDLVVSAAVATCAGWEAQLPQSWSSQTPAEARVGLLGVSLMRAHGDDSPVALASWDSPIEVDLSAGAELARLDLGEIPEGEYTWVSLSLAWGAFEVDATAHEGVTAPGTLGFDIALADYTDADGASRDQGDVELTFEVYGTSVTQATSLSLSCPLSYTGGHHDPSGGGYRVRVPVPPLSVDHGAPEELLVELDFPLEEAFAWEDRDDEGFASGVFDLTASSSTTESPLTLPTCAFLLADRCAGDAELARLDPPGPMPDSSTTACVDAEGALTTCPAEGEDTWGQDGSYALNPPSWSAADGVVRDEVTGLSWQQEASAETVDWWEARETCAALELGGHDDWTVPTRQELITLLDMGAYDPSIDEVAFPDASADFTWSATPLPFSGLAWGVRFDQGHVYDHDPEGDGYVRCVRRPDRAEERWSADDELVVDLVTGLVWQRALDEGAYTWVEALAYCEDLELSGATDWRLPNAKELLTTVDDRLAAPAVDLAVFPETPAVWLWSSSPMMPGGGYAWATSLTDGYSTAAATGERYRARCVR